jgi:glycosyltransferase involved in cell wall biosynthesis
MSTKKIKILYTIPNFETAGSGKVVYDLVKHLDTERFEPHICCIHGRGDFFEEIESLEVPIHLFQFTTSYRPFLSFPYRVLKIARFFKKHQFDLIHSWHWSSDFSEPLAAKIVRIPFIYTKKNMGWGNKSWRWKSGLSSRIVTINTDMNTLFFDHFRNKIAYIPIGVDLNYYSIKKKSYSCGKELVFKKGDYIITTISNLLPIKGIEVLIHAVNALNNVRIKLCIVGNNTSSYAQKLKEIAAINSNIYFVGAKLDVRPYHEIADLFVIPSLALGEGLGVAALEVMASGRIAIGSNVSGIKDVLEPFKDCLFVPNDVESLKDRILHVMNMDENKREILQIEMRANVEKVFSLEGCVLKHEALYKEILG